MLTEASLAEGVGDRGVRDGTGCATFWVRARKVLKLG